MPIWATEDDGGGVERMNMSDSGDGVEAPRPWLWSGAELSQPANLGSAPPRKVVPIPPCQSPPTPSELRLASPKPPTEHKSSAHRPLNEPLTPKRERVAQRDAGDATAAQRPQTLLELWARRSEPSVSESERGMGFAGVEVSSGQVKPRPRGLGLGAVSAC